MSRCTHDPLEILQNYKVKNQMMLNFPKHLDDLPKPLMIFQNVKMKFFISYKVNNEQVCYQEDT